MQPFVNPAYFQYQPYQPQMPQMPTMPSQSIQNPITGINGKWVDNFDLLTANDVPMQGISVFPKNDLSEIVCKKWNANGIIETVSYLPQKAVEEDSAIKSSDEMIKSQFEEIRGSIEAINEKIDKLIKPSKARKEVADES